ncbi:MAG: hypothetical protein PHC36_00645 [Eubacteriales bacterium]|nr:hypothetical protein [Eubacteriales bacterium]
MPTTHKDYVTVVARHELSGRIRPVAYQLPGGSSVKIDCISDERQAASLKSGGQGMRSMLIHKANAEYLLGLDCQEEDRQKERQREEK